MKDHGLEGTTGKSGMVGSFRSRDAHECSRYGRGDSDESPMVAIKGTDGTDGASSSRATQNVGRVIWTSNCDYDEKKRASTTSYMRTITTTRSSLTRKT